MAASFIHLSIHLPSNVKKKVLCKEQAHLCLSSGRLCLQCLLAFSKLEDYGAEGNPNRKHPENISPHQYRNASEIKRMQYKRGGNSPIFCSPLYRAGDLCMQHSLCPHQHVSAPLSWSLFAHTALSKSFFLGPAAPSQFPLGGMC